MVAEASAAFPESLKPPLPSRKRLPSYRLLLLVIKYMSKHPIAAPMNKHAIATPATAPPPSLLPSPEKLGVLVEEWRRASVEVIPVAADEVGVLVVVIMVSTVNEVDGPQTIPVPVGGIAYGMTDVDVVTKVVEYKPSSRMARIGALLADIFNPGFKWFLHESSLGM